jgi:hypothetical protein
MLLVLPVIAFLLFYLSLREKGEEWRWALLGAAISCGTCVVAITELLSVPRWISPRLVALFWAVICAATFFHLRPLRRNSFTQTQTQSSNAQRSAIDNGDKWLFGGVALIVVIVAITAFVAPPDKWDAMDYHLPRVIMWMSNHSVRFYPTPDYCQLIYGSWSEYAMMHTRLLWGTDRFVNFVEFFSMLGALIAVSLIAQKLGAGPRGQLLAAVVCVTIPQGLLEASGPMNTYVVSFWIATTVAFFSRWNDEPTWLNTVCIGLAAGLAIFTKGTAYITLPFVLVACWLMGTRARRVLLLKRAAVLAGLILLINGPLFLRNYQFSGSPIGVPLPVSYPRVELSMAKLTVRGTAANILRNASMHLSTPSNSLNSRIEKAVRLVIRATGSDPDDPQQSWIGKRFHLNHFTSNESIEGNPLHLVLLLLAIGAVFYTGRQEIRRRWAMWYATGIVLSYILFCALLRWQQWSSRFQLTFFVLGAALIGLLLEKYLARQWATLICLVLLLPALSLSLTNRSRSLLPWSRVVDVYQPRPILYFSDYHEAVAPSYIAAASFVNHTGCGSVAIDSFTPDPQVKSGPDSFFVYPLLALIHADGRTRRVWYSGVHNLSSKYEKDVDHPAPCAVICLDCAEVPEKWKEYEDVGGRASVFGTLVVFSREGAIPNRRRVQTTLAAE